jgi:prevent-host-death family protein
MRWRGSSQQLGTALRTRRRPGQAAAAQAFGLVYRPGGYFTKYQFSGLMLSIELCGRAPLRLSAILVSWEAAYADAVAPRACLAASRPGRLCTRYRVHWRVVEETQSQLSVRDARAHFAEILSRAEGGTPTVITRNGRAIAAVVPIEDYNALEDAIDRYFAKQADRDLADNPDAPTYSMSEAVAAIFEEEPGKGVA